MATEDVRTRLRRKLVETFGMDEADLLLDRPPGGWGDLVTNQTLDLRFAAFEARMEGRFAELESRTAGGFEKVDLKLELQRHDLIGQIERGFRRQTWQLVGTMTALMAIVVTALRV
jgi:hypothetical protein